MKQVDGKQYNGFFSVLRGRLLWIFFVVPFVPLLAQNDGEKCDLNPIYHLIYEKKIADAYERMSGIMKRCQGSEADLLRARLAFWTGHLDEAVALEPRLESNSTLVHQIETARILRDLKKGKRTKIPSALAGNYDILIEEIRIATRKKEYRRGLRLARELERHYPGKEALELQARFLLWMERYRESLRLYRKLDDHEQVRQIEQILLDRKLAMLNKGIEERWREGNRSAARGLFDSLISSQERDAFRSRYRENACRVETMHMIGIGVDFRRYSDHRYRDRNNYLEWTLPIGDGTFYGKFEETDRYGKNDRKISVELYPPGRGGYWGYLALSYSPRASFYSDYSIAGYLYKEWGADQWGIGYHYSHYPLQDSHLVQLDYTHYLSDYMTLRGVYYYDIQSRSYAMLGEWRYHTPCHLDLKATYVYSSSNELLPDSRLLDDRGHNVELYVEYPFQKAFSLGGKLLWQKSLGYSRYTAEGVSFFLRKYW